MKTIRNLLAGTALACAFAVPAVAQDLSGAALLTAMKSGGYVVYLRHAMSDTSQTDAEPFKADCAAQRNLSDAGKAQAKSIGETFKASGVAVDQVMSSAYCRAKDTASLAFGKADVSPALFYSLGLSKDDAAKAGAELKKLLATAPKAGTNTVLVGHTSNLKEVAGVWPKKEGSAYVFKPDGNGGFAVAGTLEPTDYKAGS